MQWNFLLNYSCFTCLYLFRYWRRWLRLRKMLARTCRRMILKPPLTLWYNSTLTLVRDKNITMHMQKRIQRRVKKYLLNYWRERSARKSAVFRLGQQLQRKNILFRKRSLLYLWMRRIDNKISLDKFEATQMLVKRNCKRRCLFHWHKQVLLSELCTWKSTKAAVRNWHLTACVAQKMRLAYDRAVAFHDAFLAQVYLYLWHKRCRRKLFLKGRRMKALRLRDLRKYLLHFRKWKRRMHIVYRVKYLVHPNQQKANLASLWRATLKWKR
jgi:hypothetical protein